MAHLAFTRFPVSPTAYEWHAVPAGSRPIDWLQAHHPAGAGGPVGHYHNGELLDPDQEASGYLVRPIGEGDRVVLFVPPQGEALVAIIITAVITAIVSAAITIGFSLLFPDPKPSTAAAQDAGNPSPVYNLRSRQNLARLGEPVPAVYGSVLMAPDLIAQPYSVFYGDRGMYTDQLLCLGHGEFDIHEILVGETEAASIEGGVQYIVVPPSVHGGLFGGLNALSVANGWTSGFNENTWTSLEVADQRFSTTDDVAGFYRLGRAGRQIGRNMFFNIEWPAGLFRQTSSGVNFTFVSFTMYVVEADANGAPIAGTEMAFDFGETSSSQDPLRRVYQIDTGRPAAWLVKLHRHTVANPLGNERNEFYWRSMSLICFHDRPEAYGNTTLLMMRLTASEITRAAERLIRVRMTRKLPALGTGANVATTSPADAFIDVMTNQTYGARRPLAELDGARLEALRAYWGAYQFNAVYTQRTTVWEALGQTVAGVAAAPMPIGPLMSLVQDGERPARSLLFTEQNIVKQSFKLGYSFAQTGEADGIEIEYVDPANFAPAYVRFPLESLAPDRLNLFGCTDARQAGQYARLQWQRRQKLRRSVEFSTELEGLIPLPGERVAVAHTLPRWGVSGYVAQVDGLFVQLDRSLPWTEVTGPYYMMFRDELGGCSAIVEARPSPLQGDQYAELLASPWEAGADGWRVGLRQENTHFSWGDGARVVKDWTLVGLSPKSSDAATVGVQGICYDPTVYADTLDFFVNPPPE